MIRLFFGSPGAGKTTLAVALVKRFQKKKNPPYDYYFLNFDTSISGSSSCSLVGLGEWSFPERSYVSVDEAGIEYNNRQFKSLPKSTIAWLKLHRHYKCDIDFFSQSWEDTDVTIRRLAAEYWYVKKIGFFTLVRRVYKKVTVDDNSHQIIDGFWFGKIIKRFLPFPFGSRTWYLIYRPNYYKFFDSYSCPKLPIRYFGYHSDDRS